MEVQTNQLAALPPPDTLPVAHARVPQTNPASAPAAPGLVDTVDIVPDLGNRTPSAAVETLQQRRRANTPTGVRLQVDESVDRVIAQIVNENNEVIKQIPPEEAVRVFARFREITGLLFDIEI